MNRIDKYIPEPVLTRVSNGVFASFTESQMREAIKAAVLDERKACADACYDMVLFGPVAEVQQRYNKAYLDCREAILRRTDP